jgi:hypothetical protein
VNKHVWRFLAIACGLAACVQQEGPADDDGTTEAGPAATVTISGEINGVNLAGIAGVQLCDTSHPSVPCATTDANGRYALSQLPGHANIDLEVTGTGLVPVNMQLRTDGQNFGYFQTMVAPAMVDAFTSLAGGIPESGKAIVSVTSYTMTNGAFPPDNKDVDAGTTKLAGFAYTLSPFAGILNYVGDNGVPNRDLRVTSSFGLASFLSVTPGDYDVEMTDAPPGYACNNRWLRKGTTPGTVRVRAKPDHMTGMWTRCVPCSGTPSSCTQGTPPYDVQILVPNQPGAVFTGTQAALDAGAYDNLGIDRIDYLVDGVLLGTSTPTIYGYILVFDSTQLSNGSHAFQAKAYDISGNSSTSEPVIVQVVN